MTMVDLNQLAAAKMLRRDLPLDEATVELELEVMTNGFVTPRGELLDAGTHRITVYASEVAALERLVETATDEDWRRVREDLAWHQQQAEDPNGQHRPFLPSLPASFREVVKRDLRPLKSVKRAGDKGGKKAA